MAIGEYSKAVDLLEQSAKYFEQTLGVEHLRTATAWSHLGLAYKAAGRPDDAVNIHLKEIAINESILGVDHHDTLLSRNRLAISYRSLAQFSDAEAIFELLLEKMRATLGGEHHDTVALMNNLASCYQISGDPAKRAMAIPLQEQALKLTRITKGDRHPDSIRMASTLASVYSQNGQVEKSYALSEEVLSLAQDVFGSEHPYTVSVMAPVIAAYASTNRQREAIELEKQALATARKIMPDHPDFIDWLTRVSNRYTRVHDHERALPLNLEALELSRSIRGSTNRRTLQLLESVASNLGGLRRYMEQVQALEQLQTLNDQAQESNRRVLPRSLSPLAGAYANAGFYLKSIKLYSQELEQIAERGLESRILATTYHKLIACYSEAGLDDQAIELAMELLQQHKGRSSNQVSDTSMAMRTLAVAYQKAGKTSAAVEILQELYNKEERSGPSLRLQLLQLAVAYRLDRQNEQAIELFERFLSPENESMSFAKGRARLGLAKTRLALDQREQAAAIYQQVAEDSIPILDRLEIPPSTELRVESSGDTNFYHVPPRPPNAKSVMRPLSILADLFAQLGQLESARNQLATLAYYQQQLVGVSNSDYKSTLARLSVVQEAIGSATSEREFIEPLESTAAENSYYRALAGINLADMAGFRKELSALEQTYAIEPTPEVLYWIVNASVLYPAAASDHLLDLREQLLAASQSERCRLVAAAALVRSGDFELAVEELEALLQAWLDLDPKPQDCPLVLIRHWLALAYAGAGSHEQALQCALAADAWFDADRSEFPWELFLSCQILSDEFVVGP